MGTTASALLHRLYRRLGRHRFAIRAASLVRNQLDAVIRYHFSDSFYQAEQIDDRVLELVGPLVTTFMDVGANVGGWSVALLRHCPLARGCLVEPGMISREAKAALAGFPGVMVLDAAAGEREGAASFFESASASQGSTLVEGAHLDDAIARSVPIITVDGELARLGWSELDILKIDAEGFDLDVLRGAREVIGRRAIRWIQFEYNTHWRVRGSTLLAAARLLEGYELFLSLSDGLHRANLARYGEYFAYSNYLAVRPDALSVLSPLIRTPL